MSNAFVPVAPETLALMLQQAMDTSFSKQQARDVVRELQRTETERGRLQRIVDDVHQSKTNLRETFAAEKAALIRELEETKAKLAQSEQRGFGPVE